MTVKKGDTVAVHYTGKLDSGEQFDSSEGRDPLVFQVGEGQVIPGFDEAVMGMTEGDSKTVRIDPENAYGPRRDDLVVQVDRQAFEGNEIAKGQAVQVMDQQGNAYPATVVEFDEKTVTVDLNHQLAGQALNFELEVVGINP